MKVILKEYIDALGNVGDIVNVADGYARNYLLPKSLAVIANEANVKVVEQQKSAVLKQEEKITVEMKSVAEKLKKEESLNIKCKVGEEDKLFGSVTSADIANILKEKGYEVDKKQILLDAPLNSLGVFPVKIKLYKGVEAEIKVWIEKE